MSLRPHHLFPTLMTQMKLLVLDLLPTADNSCRVHCTNITCAPHQCRSGDLTICYHTLFLASSFITSKQEMGVKKGKKSVLKVCVLDVCEIISCILAQGKIYVLLVQWQDLNGSEICSVALYIISKWNKHCPGIHCSSEKSSEKLKSYFPQLKQKSQRVQI